MRLSEMLVDRIATAAWCVLNHDNSPQDRSDPCHAQNWRTLKSEIRKAIKAAKPSTKSKA
jgi:hypothetical protein